MASCSNCIKWKHRPLLRTCATIRRNSSRLLISHKFLDGVAKSRLRSTACRCFIKNLCNTIRTPFQNPTSNLHCAATTGWKNKPWCEFPPTRPPTQNHLHFRQQQLNRSSRAEFLLPHHQRILKRQVSRRNPCPIESHHPQQKLQAKLSDHPLKPLVPE